MPVVTRAIPMLLSAGLVLSAVDAAPATGARPNPPDGMVVAPLPSMRLRQATAWAEVEGTQVAARPGDGVLIVTDWDTGQPGPPNDTVAPERQSDLILAVLPTLEPEGAMAAMAAGFDGISVPVSADQASVEAAARLLGFLRLRNPDFLVILDLGDQAPDMEWVALGADALLLRHVLRDATGERYGDAEQERRGRALETTVRTGIPVLLAETAPEAARGVIAAEIRDAGAIPFVTVASEQP